MGVKPPPALGSDISKIFLAETGLLKNVRDLAHSLPKGATAPLEASL